MIFVAHGVFVGLSARVVKSMVSSKFHYKMKLSGDFAHMNVMQSGMHSLGLLVVRIPGKHALMVSIQLNVRNENDELTTRLLTGTDEELGGVLNSGLISFSSDNSLMKPVKKAWPHMKYAIPDYEHLFREMMVSAPKPNKVQKELLAQCVVRSNPMVLQSTMDVLARSDSGRKLLAKYFSDSDPGSDIRQMCLSQRAATRQHPQDDKCACAETINNKLKRDGARDCGAVSSLAKAEMGSWQSLKKVYDEWKTLYDRDHDATLPSFTSLMVQSENRARASKVAVLVNGPKDIYQVTDNKVELSNVVNLKVRRQFEHAHVHYPLFQRPLATTCGQGSQCCVAVYTEPMLIPPFSRPFRPYQLHS
jgi:hypothetical protein